MDAVPVVGVDWLQGTFPKRYLAVAVEFLSRWFGEGTDRGYGNRFYDSGIQFGEGVILVWSEAEAGRPEAMLSVSGVGISRLSPDDEAAFVVGCYVGLTGDEAVPLKCTQIDVRFDDYDKRVDYATMLAFCESGMFGPFEEWNVIGCESKGWTFNFGARGKLGCGRKVKVYHKGKESGGVIDAIRFEPSWFKEFAAGAYSVLCAAFSNGEYGGDENGPGGAEMYRRACGALVAGSIKFYGDAEHREVAPFWAGFRVKVWGAPYLGSAGAVRICGGFAGLFPSGVFADLGDFGEGVRSGKRCKARALVVSVNRRVWGD